MSKIFTSYKIKNAELKNRLIRSATTSYWSDEEGILRRPILEYYDLLAKGGLGFIIKGHSYVLESGKAHTGQSGLTNEKHLPKMKELTKIVHSDNVPIIAQINHAGMSAKADRVTASHYVTENWEAREASIDDIQQIIEGFANAADFAIQAGFDGVQIHGAHGYLVSQFLSDRVNKREDKYGGTLENRARLLFEIFDAVKKKIGNAHIIGIKMNCDDFAPEGGITIKDSVVIANWLDEKGIDLIEISGGGPEQNRDIRKTRAKPAEDSPYYEANFSGHAEMIRRTVPTVPLALVDGIRNVSTMDAILDCNLADLISMSKPLINEPDLPNKLKEGQPESNCIDCRECVSRERFGQMMLSCAQLVK
ncbi:MAG: NADH:flavin oxidoreductase [Candidatus Heimdallarchaeota archaeon]|nr:NADH:flavin oxidoreductase [Candidatus Heimdallarchaeota archaeon]MCK4291342.1 NADH:flavin oxidoreductase [Candidatus Heimdallarchaeota archaeon]